MAAAEERLLSEGDGGALCAARLSPTPLPPAPEAPALLEQPPQSNTLMGLPIVAIESILSFLSYDETSQLRLVGAGPWGGGPCGGRAPCPGVWRGRDEAGGFLVSYGARRFVASRGAWCGGGSASRPAWGVLSARGGEAPGVPGAQPRLWGAERSPAGLRGRLLLASVLAGRRKGAACAGKHRHIKKNNSSRVSEEIGV